MFFDGWHGVVRVLMVASIGYVGLLVMLRLSRKRTIAQMNMFDFLYVIVIGELLAITIMDDRVSMAEGMAGVSVLILFQVLISWLTTRSKRVEQVINGEPTLLMRRGRFLRDAMHAQRVTERELLSIVREEGIGDLGEVEAIVLETNGGFSVIHQGKPSSASTLRDVPGADMRDDRPGPPAAPRERPLARPVMTKHADRAAR